MRMTLIPAADIDYNPIPCSVLLILMGDCRNSRGEIDSSSPRNNDLRSMFSIAATELIPRMTYLPV